MNERPLALLPELLLLAGAVTTLLTGAFLPRDRQWVARLVAAGAMFAAMVATLPAVGERATVYAHSYALDAGTTAARLLIPLAGLLVVGIAAGRVAGNRRETEFSVLTLLAVLGAVLLAGASDLLLLAVAYLLSSVPLVGLAGWGRDRRGAEAALKVYLIGALAGVGLLAGAALLTAVGGGASDYDRLATGLAGAPSAAVAVGVVGVLAGLLFKIGAVPGHFWVPDAVQGASIPAGALLTTVPKLGGLLAAYRLFAVAVPADVVGWPLLVAVLAAVTMTLGNFAAFGQADPRRLLAYSTVAQVGYLLMAVAVAGRAERALPALLVYLAGYAVTNLGAFAVLAAEPHDALDDYRGLARRRPWLAGALAICLLGLVGTPPTAVFAGKLTVFTAAWDGGLAWLVVVAAVNTVASLFYYLRWLAPAYTGGGRWPTTGGRNRTVAAAGAVAAGAALLGAAVAVPWYPLMAQALAR
ncbi:proton-conducting transporter membrane subunit [Micromonospora sp. WMMD1128]|uniref:NADH-quinone oxidoreductase subunit N n=1 Tax=Micromonospora sp. WMMD1128 TaxID=3015150 RepID=UPI00248B971C|nr:proton-conducting transporter membrane subunit [Micromonospora sp. WMMD1128]WBB71371.1 proton-conducting transporter membrane subunit [Micromonospora sp. WMMD1128]